MSLLMLGAESVLTLFLWSGNTTSCTDGCNNKDNTTSTHTGNKVFKVPANTLSMHSQISAN